MSNPHQTKVGHIGFEDHRFRGRSVLNDLMDHTDTLEILWLGLTGRTLSPEDRQILSWLAISATAADPRVWPLKITRLLSSYGNPYAGFYGGQLATPSDRIGAGSLNQSTQALLALQEALDQLGKPLSSENLKPILIEYLEKHRILNGFGVPFRKTDERLDALMKRIKGHSAEKKTYWKLASLLMAEMRELKSVEPNISLAVAALLLDLGIQSEETPFVCSLLIMAPCFSSHALEASHSEFSPWREVKDSQIEYKGKVKRSLSKDF